MPLKVRLKDETWCSMAKSPTSKIIIEIKRGLMTKHQAIFYLRVCLARTRFYNALWQLSGVILIRHMPKISYTSEELKTITSVARM